MLDFSRFFFCAAKYTKEERGGVLIGQRTIEGARCWSVLQSAKNKVIESTVVVDCIACLLKIAVELA